MNQARSPLPWVGGKHYSASRIIKEFPQPDRYDVYCEVFCGACHVFIAKPPYKHVEIINDINNDLVNFWIQCRDNVSILEERCKTLPYSRKLYYDYHQSLFDGTQLDETERAARWFYVLRSNFNGYLRPSPCGWSMSLKDKNHGPVHAYYNAINLFTILKERFQYVAINNRDFASILKQGDRPRTLFYVDPPYINVEQYYEHPFTMLDHERLAQLLNKTKAYVALSYYPHPLLDKWYPAEKWRRVTWQTPKHSQRTKATHDIATELLLCNYPAVSYSLWDQEESA